MYTKVLNLLFALIVLLIGLINTFWGNDPGFGVFLILLSFVYVPPVTDLIRKRAGFALPAWVKIALGLFITWAALGVGELFGKIDLMLRDFQNIGG